MTFPLSLNVDKCTKVDKNMRWMSVYKKWRCPKVNNYKSQK
jgi:hypothetical protein